MTIQLVDRVSTADLALLTPANLREITDGAADSSLPQTVWPGTDTPLTSMAMPARWDAPTDARPGSLPLVTVLPACYFENWSRS